MGKAIKYAVVAVCLLCILAICIAPLVDLPATSLRSYQTAVVLLWGLIAVAFSLALSVFKPLAALWVASSGFDRREPEWRIGAPLKFSSVLRC
ncbi:MAG TPA: hypothetical protein VGU67_10465 [Edaphobacter sp.]|nr:hypothetical protein [Edaphobacter sp.]